jgi:Short C-terminal domain
MKTALLIILALGAPGLAQGQFQAVPSKPTTWQFSIPLERGAAATAVQEGGQAFGLVPSAVDRESWLVKFEPAALSAEKLDVYCTYPLIWKFNKQPFDTFAGWNQRSSKAGGGSVTGSVVVIVRLSEEGAGSAASVTATFSGGNSQERHDLNAKGKKFQSEFQAYVLAKVTSAAAAPAPPAPDTAPPPAGLSKVEQLERLAALRDKGVLTEEEFQAEKRKILGAPPP